MASTAFVKIVRSNMPHNNGELFYQVCYTDEEGKLCGLADAMLYPWAWGFKDLKHALRVADDFNDPYSDENTYKLIQRLGAEEHEVTTGRNDKAYKDAFQLAIETLQCYATAPQLGNLDVGERARHALKGIEALTNVGASSVRPSK